MRNRITWQNVAAPSFRDAILATGQAGNAFTQAFDTAAGIAGEIREGQKERASADAITQALGITDPTELARAVSSGQLFDSRNLTDEALTFFQNQRGSLLADQQTMAQTRGVDARTDRTIYDLNRARTRNPILDAQNDWKFGFDKEDAIYEQGRDRAVDAREDAGLLITTAARQEVDKIMSSGSVSNAQELNEQLVSKGLPANVREAALDYAQGLDEANFAISDLTRDAVVFDPLPQSGEAGLAFGQLGESLTARQSEADFAFGGNTALRLYAESMQTFEGTSNPIQSVIDQRFEGAEDSPELNETRNSLVRDFSTLKREFKNVPEEVIAGVLDRSMEAGGVGGSGWLSGGRPEVALNEARRLLREINTPAIREQLNSQYQTYQRNTERVSDFDNQYQALLEDAAKARRDGDVSGERAAAEAAQKLLNEAIKWMEDNPVTAAQQEEILRAAREGATQTRRDSR